MNLSDVFNEVLQLLSLKVHLNVVILYNLGISKKHLNPASVTKGHLNSTSKTSFAINLHLIDLAYLNVFTEKINFFGFSSSFNSSSSSVISLFLDSSFSSIYFFLLCFISDSSSLFNSLVIVLSLKLGVNNLFLFIKYSSVTG